MRNILPVWMMLQTISCTLYYFRPNDNFEYLINWVNEAVPCEGDRIRFDEQKIAVTMIDEPIAVSEIFLPNDGIIFFASNTTIGQKGDWQCERRTKPEDAFFKTSTAASFFNGSNWFSAVEGKQTGFLLHALQVPSDQDTAIIQVTASNRILVDDFIKLGAFYFSDRMVSGKQFDLSALWTIEGQFQFVLSPKLKSDVVIDDIQYQWPKFTNTVTIMGPSYERTIFGKRSSNLEPNIMAIICSYQKCPNADKICLSPIQPVGHCCPVCGSMLTFRGTGIIFGKLLENLRIFQAQSAFVHMYHLDVSLLRVDHDEILPTYQVVVLGQSDSIYDERVYYETLQEVIDVLYKSYEYTNEMSLFDLTKHYSRDLRAFGIVDAIIVLFFLFVISAVIFAITMTIRQYHTDPRVRQLLESRAFNALAVRWRGNKPEQDQLELLSGDVDDMVSGQEDEGCSTFGGSDGSTNFTNINFTEEKQHVRFATNINDSAL